MTELLLAFDDVSVLILGRFHVFLHALYTAVIILLLNGCFHGIDLFVQLLHVFVMGETLRMVGIQLQTFANFTETNFFIFLSKILQKLSKPWKIMKICRIFSSETNFSFSFQKFFKNLKISTILKICKIFCQFFSGNFEIIEFLKQVPTNAKSTNTMLATLPQQGYQIEMECERYECYSHSR